MPAIGNHGIVHGIGHGLLTTMLALGYAAVAVFLAQFPSGILGFSGLAVASSTLVVAALLWPAWRRIQGAVDRRFNRRRVGAGVHR
jgi:membrane protein implicated in regulation of membrane protease activity